MGVDKEKELDRLSVEIVENQVCEDLAESATQLVIGEGNPDADVVFIGEAPGKNEDIQGRPFVGAAGKFLDEMLSGIDMKRSEVYITNIVKYRPPGNRDPSETEKSEFAPYLDKQMSIIQPKIIVTLGRHSMEYFLPGLKISQIHGQPKRKAGIVYLPLYHPAAALYNGNMKQILINDFEKIPTILNKLN